MDVSFGSHDSITIDGLHTPLNAHRDECLGAPKYIGDFNNFPMAWYLTQYEVVMVAVGCQHKTLAESIKYWAGKPDRREIYETCLWLEGIAKMKNWKVGFPSTVDVPTDKLIEAIDTLRSDGFDYLAGEFEQLLADNKGTADNG